MERVIWGNSDESGKWKLEDGNFKIVGICNWNSKLEFRIGIQNGNSELRFRTQI